MGLADHIIEFDTITFSPGPSGDIQTYIFKNVYGSVPKIVLTPVGQNINVFVGEVNKSQAEIRISILPTVDTIVYIRVIGKI